MFLIRFSLFRQSCKDEVVPGGKPLAGRKWREDIGATRGDSVTKPDYFFKIIIHILMTVIKQITKQIIIFPRLRCGVFGQINFIYSQLIRKIKK